MKDNAETIATAQGIQLVNEFSFYQGLTPASDTHSRIGRGYYNPKMVQEYKCYFCARGKELMTRILNP